MKELWQISKILISALGGWLGVYLGGIDGILTMLVIFVSVDYITGVMCAISSKKLSSSVGFKGIFRKIIIFVLVGIANMIDMYILGKGSVIRTAVIFFYLSNEGISLLENVSKLGLPIPEKLKLILVQLREKDGEK